MRTYIRSARFVYVMVYGSGMAESIYSVKICVPLNSALRFDTSQRCHLAQAIADMHHNAGMPRPQLATSDGKTLLLSFRAK